jgi:HD superfamily phosphohydrolase
MADVPDDLLDSDHAVILEREREIADVAGVDPERVIVDVPPRPALRETSARILVHGEVRRLHQQSAIVDALRTVQREQWRLGVYTMPEFVEVVGHAAQRTLDLSVEGRLISDRQGRFVPLDEFE